MKKEFNIFFVNYLRKNNNENMLKKCFRTYKNLIKEFSEIDYQTVYEKIIVFCETLNQYKLNGKNINLDFNSILKDQCHFYAENGFNKKISWEFIKLSNFNLYKDFLTSSNKKVNLDFFNKIAINETTNLFPFNVGKKSIWKEIINFFLTYYSNKNIDEKYFVFLSYIFFKIIKNNIFTQNNLTIALTILFLSPLIHNISNEFLFDLSFEVNENKKEFIEKLGEAIKNENEYLESFISYFINIFEKSFKRSSHNMNYFIVNSQLTFFKFRELFGIKLNMNDFNNDIFSEPYFDQLDLEYSFELENQKLNDVMETIVNKKIANVISHKNHQVFLTFWWISLFFDEHQNKNRVAEMKSKQIWDSINFIKN